MRCHARIRNALTSRFDRVGHTHTCHLDIPKHITKNHVKTTNWLVSLRRPKGLLIYVGIPIGINGIRQLVLTSNFIVLCKNFVGGSCVAF